MRVLTAAAVVFTCVLVGVAARPTAQGQQGQAQGQPKGQAQGQGKGAPQTLTNIQVLPKDWTFQQVVAYMRVNAAALGVECDHCHVGGQADRAKDDKPEKATARKMMKMVTQINEDLLKGVGDPKVAQKVTCYTCHRGAVKPLTAPAGGGGN